ncbi:alpha-lytic protease prodomain-containing protein [Streptomyces griseorubiginosus]|uniref:alpha-lytic protease prodomain-containing protein n=2 Tax=Streptomyces griseorubiginosus TaxID=67304 RepID=UPI00340BB08A
MTPPTSVTGAASAVESLGIAGTSWAVDERTGKLRVFADSTVTAADLAKVRRTTGRWAGAAALERLDGRLRTLLPGGDGVYTTGWRCSAGVNVQSGSTALLRDRRPLHGRRVHLVHRLHPDHDGRFHRRHQLPRQRPRSRPVHQPGRPAPRHDRSADVTGTATARVGQSVCRRGATMGVRCGVVTGLNISVNYGGGDVVSGRRPVSSCALRAQVRTVSVAPIPSFAATAFIAARSVG